MIGLWLSSAQLLVDESAEKLMKLLCSWSSRFRGDLDEAGVWAEPLLPTPRLGNLEMWIPGSVECVALTVVAAKKWITQSLH